MKTSNLRTAASILAASALILACSSRPATQPSAARRDAPAAAQPPAVQPAAPAVRPAALPDLANEPVLQIETGMHSTAIRRIGVDAANRWLVTGANDKTVRVWDLASGELVRTWRPPIAPGNDGKIYAVAMSPDGGLVACAGWMRSGGKTAQATGQGYAIYLFERATGRLAQRIDGLPDVVDHLVFSRDGKNLAATVHAGNGMRVYRMQDFTLAAQDGDYGSDSYGADTDKAGRLVTTCYDGFIRLYDSQFKLVAKKKAPGGNRPYSASFSPNGGLIAIGFDGSTAVNVLSGRDLSLAYAPDTTGIENGESYSVAFSADGRSLYAGGSWGPTEACLIRRWANMGRGRFTDTVASVNSILQILPLKDGGMVFGSFDPAWGILENTGERRRFISAAQAEVRGNYDGFLLSRDGGTVRFAFEYGGRSPAQFSIAARRLMTGRLQTDGALRPPRTSASGLEVANWKHNTAPKLNGRAIALERNETCRSLAVAPDGQSFLLGAEWSLRLFDRDGSQRWSTPVPTVAWLVNVSEDGRSAAAALGDGTVRWYDMRNGRELLALFAHADRKRWVLWTPGGYYDCSPGGEELIGWHVNNGRAAAADFYPAARFRSTFYRPDVVARVLGARGEQEALRLANAEAGRRDEQADLLKRLPPTVTILSPSDGESVPAGELRLRYQLHWPPEAPVTAVRALIDGRPEGGPRGLEGAAAARELVLANPGRDCEIALVAENKNGASEAARVRIKFAGAAQPAAPKAKLNVLAVGVGAYRDARLALKYPAKDARDFAAFMQAQQGGFYREVAVKLLGDQDATKEGILQGLDWLRETSAAGDVSIVFFAGQGVNAVDGFYFFLPVEADPDDLLRTAVFFSDVRDSLAALPGRALLIMDSCRAGGDITGVVNELSSAENGVVVFASTSGGQRSLEDERWGNGAFTRALLDGLAGGADPDGRGRISVNMLEAYLAERLGELTDGRQIPTAMRPRTVPDFPLAGKPSR